MLWRTLMKLGASSADPEQGCSEKSRSATVSRNHVQLYMKIWLLSVCCLQNSSSALFDSTLLTVYRLYFNALNCNALEYCHRLNGLMCTNISYCLYVKDGPISV